MCCGTENYLTGAAFRERSRWYFKDFGRLGVKGHGRLSQGISLVVGGLTLGLTILFVFCATLPLGEPELVLILLAAPLFLKQRAVARDSSALSRFNLKKHATTAPRDRPSAESSQFRRPLRFLPSKELGGSLAAIPEEAPWPRATFLRPGVDAASLVASLDTGGELSSVPFDAGGEPSSGPFDALWQLDLDELDDSDCFSDEDEESPRMVKSDACLFLPGYLRFFVMEDWP